MTIYNKLTINGIDYDNAIQIDVNKSSGDFKATSKFRVLFDNYNGDYDDKFDLNEEVIIYADLDTNPAVTKVFLGIIEDIKFTGQSDSERVEITGRDYGAILQDILVTPRIFKDDDAGDIIISIMSLDASETGITLNNVNLVGSTIDKITFTNISIFDCLQQLSEIAGFYFYIDADKDLHFEQRDVIASGNTFDNTNVTKADFNNTDSDIFNKVTVTGARQLTGVRETFGAQAGSVYTLDDNPHNTTVVGSSTLNVQIQPGGILDMNDPAEETVQFLVDYNSKKVILTSGTTAGDNTGWIGSSIIVNYQRSSPLVSIRQDATSQANYGEKDKAIMDKNIKNLEEANLRASSYLADHKDPVIYGKIDVYGVVDITPGETAIVNIPFHNIDSQVYSMLNAEYNFNTTNNETNKVLRVGLNRKIRDFVDYMKEQELRLRSLESSEVDTTITNTSLASGSVTMETSYSAITTDIGSGFYFHLPNHNIFRSTKSLLGDMRAGSTVVTG